MYGRARQAREYIRSKAVSRFGSKRKNVHRNYSCATKKESQREQESDASSVSTASSSRVGGPSPYATPTCQTRKSRTCKLTVTCPTFMTLEQTQRLRMLQKRRTNLLQVKRSVAGTGQHSTAMKWLSKHRTCADKLGVAIVHDIELFEIKSLLHSLEPLNE